MLDARPSGVPLDAATLAAAIDSCLDCLQACTSCADADLAEEDVVDMRACIGLCVTCADVSDVTARVLSRSTPWDNVVVHLLLQTCVRTCTSSAEECHRHAHHHRHCALCEKVCRVCIQACNALLGAEAFAELQPRASA
jgi:hypothetical protein